MLSMVGHSFSLAGYNLIYQLWKLNGMPTGQGWHVSADDLIKIHSSGKDTHSSAALVIDYDPSSKWRIGLIELLDIYLYTYRAKKDASSWSPMMLRFRDVMYVEYDHEIYQEEKSELIKEMHDLQNEDDFVEFLYLNGSDKGWNWGINGMTNGAFIQGPARAYFRQFF